jgi:Cu-Zn family superoxide dismutase
VSAPLTPTKGHEAKGNVTFEAVGEGKVRVSVEVANATPRSGHGFHIHERGDCSAPDAASAGEHFNPGKASHGGPRSSARHAGDLGNLTADDQGRVSTSFVVDGLSIGGAAPTNIVGRSIVLHSKPDDLRTQPAGDSGSRIACGVIGSWQATSAGEVGDR